MSAFVVDRHHIMYLVKAAQSRVLNYGSDFSWYHNGQRRVLSDDDSELRITNILWRENVKSVAARYQEDEDNMPGPIGEPYWITRDDLSMLWLAINPLQVIKACNCYSYQSCEYDGWETSEAKTFIDTLIAREIGRLPGYDELTWGAPEPMNKITVHVK